MAIAIKRTPVLSGKASKDFITSLSTKQTSRSKESIEQVIANTKKILTNYRSGK
jgi:hypothetical protein